MTVPARSHSDSGMPATYFAAPERASAGELRGAVERISNNPLMEAALEALGGWVAVLNEHRQVLAVNHALLESLGVDDPAGMLGLRPGEVLGCVHADDHPGGCGTSQACTTCGAAIAIVASQETGVAQDRECVLTYESDGTQFDRCFVVRSCPFRIQDEPLLLLCMRDISAEKRRTALERTFLHDLSNVLTALAGSAEVLCRSGSAHQSELLTQVHEAADALLREVEVQRLLAQDVPETYPLLITEVKPRQLLQRMDSAFSAHLAAQGQLLVVQRPEADEPFWTDVGVLTRVLANMLMNAGEAGQPGDHVRIGVGATSEAVTFFVWNRQVISEGVCGRIFQRYFSTKPGSGRGVGTYTMKLLGEQFLKGKVSFETSHTDGTTFRVELPRVLEGTHASKA